MPNGKFVARAPHPAPRRRNVDHGVVLRMTPSGPELDIDAMRARGMHVPADAVRDAVIRDAPAPSFPSMLADINKRNREFYARGRTAAGRDADVPVDGTHLGTHPPGFKYNIDSNGQLSVYNAKEDHVCTYEQGAWHILEDENGVHIGRTGNHDPFPGPDTPERIDVQDSALELLRRLNQRNADFWAGKSTWAAESAIVDFKASDLAASSVIVTGSERDSPQGVHATLRALNDRNRRFYGAKK